MNSRADSGPASGAASGGDQALIALFEAARTVEARLERTLGEIDLTHAKLKVLSHLVEAGESLPLSTLAERSACVRSNVTQLVDRLEAEGMVRRVHSPDDRRSVRAEITRVGRERQAEGAVRAARVEAEVAAALPPAVRDALAGLARAQG